MIYLFIFFFFILFYNYTYVIYYAYYAFFTVFVFALLIIIRISSVRYKLEFLSKLGWIYSVSVLGFIILTTLLLLWFLLCYILSAQIVV